MEQLDLRRVRFTDKIHNNMRMLKGRLGVSTHNLYLRVGYFMSLEEPESPKPEEYPAGQHNIPRTVLTGPYDDLMVALLRQRMAEDDADWSEAADLFSAHMNRGFELVYARAQSLPELLALAGTVTEAHPLSSAASTQAS